MKKLPLVGGWGQRPQGLGLSGAIRAPQPRAEQSMGGAHQEISGAQPQTAHPSPSVAPASAAHPPEQHNSAHFGKIGDFPKWRSDVDWPSEAWGPRPNRKMPLSAGNGRERERPGPNARADGPRLSVSWEIFDFPTQRNCATGFSGGAECCLCRTQLAGGKCCFSP